MNTAPIRPAEIVLDADGVPRSVAYGDVYHPRNGALAQARHVFLNGEETARRWRGRDRFVVLETGFGLGSNFLATWAAWRADPGRCAQLHFISIEGSPPAQAALRALDRDPELRDIGAELADRWPPSTWNLHRLSFADGAVELLLAFGDIAAWLPQLVASVDAFFLDGFAPARNPAMWDARLFKAMARLAAPGATVATWTSARAVRDGLRSAGFAIEAASGIGGKRDITRGRFAPRFAPRTSPRTSPRSVAAQGEPLRGSARSHAPIVIVGAGLAGCALAAALSERGLSSLLIERSDAIAREGSGNAAGLFHGVVHRGDGRHARFHRAASFAAHDAVRQAIDRHGAHGSVAGLLRLESAGVDRAGMQAIVDALGLPDDYVRAVDSDVASALAGVPVTGAAWEFPRGGWVDPRDLCAAWLASAGERVELRLRCDVAALQRDSDDWLVVDAAGRPIARAATVVLCNAGGAFDLLGRPPWPVARQRGQISSIAVSSLPAAALPRLPIAGAGYALPARDGAVWFGASASWDDDHDSVRIADQLANADRLTRLLGLSAPPSPTLLGGRTAFRWQSRDRLPIIGAVPADVAAQAGLAKSTRASSRLDQPRLVARESGLFVLSALGSRGIASSALGAQLLAAAIAGSPSPVEADLLDAVDPARFLVRDFRRRDSSQARPEPSTSDQPPAGPIAGSLGA